MINKILDILSENNISTFLINEDIVESEEYFFVKKQLDVKRSKNVTKYEVTVYRDFEEDNQFYRGSSSCKLNKCMSLDEMNLAITQAYNAAICVKNPYYKITSGTQMFSSDDSIVPISSETQNFSSNDVIEALFENDTNSNAFINSAEIFFTLTKHRIINSNGVNLSYSEKKCSGEYVVQCLTPTDVELYDSFEYSQTETNILESLKTKVQNMLLRIKDRSSAKYLPELTANNIILEGESVSELFHFFLDRADASNIYPKHSNFKINEAVLPEKSLHNIYHEKINIFLNPNVPFSREGIRLVDAPLIQDNILKCITGNNRFSFYLNINAIGEYKRYKLAPGKQSVITFEKQPHLKIINFSDFQMDSLSGQFGGEYRLAYYFDGTKSYPVTGGSISGNIFDIMNTIAFSSETQILSDYEGPLAVTYTI